MRPAAFLAFLALLAFSPLAVFAGGSINDDFTEATPAAHHVKIEVEADQLLLPLRLVLRGKDRAALDARLDALKATLLKRFENQDGWDVQETSFTYTRVYQTYARSSSVSKSTLFGDEEDKGEVTYEASAAWHLMTQAEKGSKGLEILRAKADGLVNPKTEGEKQTVGDPKFRIGDAEGYRNDLLAAIKADFEEVKKHLPGNGEYRLQLPGLEKPLKVTAQGGRRFVVEMPYTTSFVTPEPEKAKK